MKKPKGSKGKTAVILNVQSLSTTEASIYNANIPVICTVPFSHRRSRMAPAQKPLFPLPTE